MTAPLFRRTIPAPTHLRREIRAYLDEGKVEWKLDTSTFTLEFLPLVDLEHAIHRPLQFERLPRGADARTTGPILLDDDYSLIDGRRRVANAYHSGRKWIVAYVRDSMRQEYDLSGGVRGKYYERHHQP